MSGLEVAGVVLGAIPILVTALQSYADGVATVKGFFQYEEVYLDIHASLVVNMTILQHSCEELLRGLLIPDSQFCALIERQEGWDDQELVKKLKIRLGERGFQVYSKFANRLRKRLVLFAGKLQLKSDFTPVFIIDGKIDEKKRRQFFKSPLTRMRGAFEAGKLQKLVTEIGNDIGTLRELCKGSLDLEEERRERATASTSAYWVSMRDHAYQLFCALQSMWPESCRSHNHKASLRIGLPMSGPLHEDLATTRLCFHLKEENKAEIGRDVKIESTLPPNAGPPAIVKKARFDLPSLTGFEAEKKCYYDQKINNLCSVLTYDYQKPCLGFLHIQDKHYHIHNAQNWPHCADLLPLRKLFAERMRVGITPRERCVYAIMLASIVMQLFDTPWLSEDWTLADVYIDQSENTSHLYISKPFDQETLSTSLPSCRKQIFVKNQMVFALGVALLELTYGKQLMHLSEASDLDENNQVHMLTLYSIADRLTRDVQKFETPRFARAVAKSIHPTSDTYDFELTNDGYRNRFYMDVLQPLQEEYEALFPTS